MERCDKPMIGVEYAMTHPDHWDGVSEWECQVCGYDVAFTGPQDERPVCKWCEEGIEHGRPQALRARRKAEAEAIGA